MSLEPGSRLGPYEIQAVLGAGGMGEVYKARDPRLNRLVAIKVLPDAFAADEERLARFRREAQVLASLNHPNIGQIYGLEGDATPVRPGQPRALRALVLELVDGRTLQDVIAEGLSMSEALPIARQIAGALEAAHEAGIVHRDLKPANVKVRDDGTVKVLDFGLAKAPAPSGSTEHSPTITGRATQIGTILGTAAYMSPEQARGRAIDKRADVWAFGAVLYEMLSGRRAFDGQDVAETLAAVLRQDVDWSALPTSTPPAVRALLARCLDRDPTHRLRDIGEARIALETSAASGPDDRRVAPAAASPVPRSRPAPARALVVALVASIGVIAALVWRAATPALLPVSRLSVTLSPGLAFNLAKYPVVTISRDGSRLAFVANSQGVDRLYVRQLADFEPQVLAGTDKASSPFFSPDGSWIGFFADGKLKKVPAAGGPVITLADDAGENRGGAWLADDTIVYAPQAASAIFRVPAVGGTPVAVSTIDEARHERTHRWPSVLPDGHTMLVTIGSSAHSDDYDDATIEAIRLDTGARHTVLTGGHAASYVANGYLAFVRGKVLYVVSFDAPHARVLGTPVPMVDGVAGDVTTGAADYAVSASGAVVFVPGDPAGGDLRLAWTNADGTVATLDAAPARYADPHLSPDGRLVAVSVLSGVSQRDIYIVDTLAGSSSRLTSGPAPTWTPLWTHDSRRIVYVSYDRARNVSTILTRRADGTDDARTLAEIPGEAFADDLTSDDRTLIVSANSAAAGGRFEILRVFLDRDASPAIEIASPNGKVQSGALSPDGRWIAYYSTESGQAEVYVRSFLSKGSSVRVSTGGGVEPHWAPDGRALYYTENGGIMRVPIGSGPAFAPGRPQRLSAGWGLSPTDSGQTYSVAPKGDRFLTLHPANDGTTTPDVRVILNWLEDLTRPAVGR